MINDDIATVFTRKAPVPVGHYVQAKFHNGLVYVSGQLPVSPDGTQNCDAGFEDQARIAIDNLLAIVEAAGSSSDRILRLTAYIAGVEHWPSFNAIFAEIFGQARPARTVVPVPELHYGYLVELDAIAAVEPGWSIV